LPLPALHATHAGIWIAAGGDLREASRGEAISRLADTPHVILNAPLVGQRLGYADVSGLDLLELFAFIHPARFAVPTVSGLARATGVQPPAGESEAARTLIAIAEALLGVMAERSWPEREGAWTASATLYRLGWGWAPFVGQRLEKPERGERILFSRLAQWEDQAERPQPRTITIPTADAEQKLAELTGPGSEPRDGQRAMAAEATAIFAPRRAAGDPNMLLAEAGTGIGKTLAYLAPASLWADRSGGTVWVSTFTKALQRQLDTEGARPNWSGAGQLTARTATWWAATCPVGFPACSAVPARQR
jgi:ATP-dependent DNA helicase DinG